MNVKIEAPCAELTVWKTEGGETYTKEVAVARCPHCRQADVLIVSEVELSNQPPEKFPFAVHCGNCGARGPWSVPGDEEGAVLAWNNSQGFKTETLSDWKHLEIKNTGNDDGLPF